MSDDGDESPDAETTDGDAAESDDKSFLGALSLVGLISFCCIGIGAAAGTAALAGGTVGTTVAIGGAGTRGTLISALVTGLTVVAVTLVVRWRQGQAAVAAAAEQQAVSLDSVATEIDHLNDQTDQLCGSLNQFVIDVDTDFSDLDTVVEAGDTTGLAVEGSSGGSTATADGGTVLSEDDESRDTSRPADATGFELGST